MKSSETVAVVTGAGKGIGLAVARELGVRGYQVVVSDVDAAAAQRAAETIDGAVVILCDVSDEAQVQNLVEESVERFGAIGVMVPNAGIGIAGPLLGTDLGTWRRMIAVNLDGVFLCMRHAAQAMAEGGGGSIVNISSVTGLGGTPLFGGYAATKAAVLNLTKTAATEWRPMNIRVNAVLPGFVGTDLMHDITPDLEKFAQLGEGGFDTLVEQKQGRYGTVEDVAKAVAYLASEEQSWITGTGLTVDGGLTSAAF
jgi:NAD(P)-dependent dehydrogenase (short-subunit alcohol dehydrogenase family)